MVLEKQSKNGTKYRKDRGEALIVHAANEEIWLFKRWSAVYSFFSYSSSSSDKVGIWLVVAVEDGIAADLQFLIVVQYLSSINFIFFIFIFFYFYLFYLFLFIFRNYETAQTRGTEKTERSERSEEEIIECILCRTNSSPILPTTSSTI